MTLSLSLIIKVKVSKGRLVILSFCHSRASHWKKKKKKLPTKAPNEVQTFAQRKVFALVPRQREERRGGGRRRDEERPCGNQEPVVVLKREMERGTTRRHLEDPLQE